MCSFRFSPVPTPSEKRPGIWLAAVAAAWATIAGGIRVVGQVPPVISASRSVACATAPSTPQTKGLLPCLSTQGWKWSEIPANSKPARSARTACAVNARGPNSSHESVYPIAAPPNCIKFSTQQIEKLMQFGTRRLLLLPAAPGRARARSHRPAGGRLQRRRRAAVGVAHPVQEVFERVEGGDAGLPAELGAGPRGV